ncbi:MAG: hypothetical protein ABF705_00005, partial [Acetobacter syzygii]
IKPFNKLVFTALIYFLWELKPKTPLINEPLHELTQEEPPWLKLTFRHISHYVPTLHLLVLWGLA